MVKFFINRPIFATVLALIIVVAGLVTLNILPIAQYPEITPPTVKEDNRLFGRFILMFEAAFRSP